MREPFLGRWRRGLVRLLRLLFAVDPGPSNLAGEVADRLFDKLTPARRILLRQRFGVDQQTNADLEEIASPFSTTRRRRRDIESQALIRLYRWEARRSRLPAVQRRLVHRIAVAHHEILDTLCDAPPIRSVLVGWHDQLVDSRRLAGEIATPPNPVIPDNPKEEPQTPELVLAAMLRRALWAHARGRKATRQQSNEQTVHEDERTTALEVLRATHFNAQSILALAEAPLGHARRIQGDRPLDPAMDLDAPAQPDVLESDPRLADIIAAESGMEVGNLQDCAAGINRSLAKARHNLRLLVDSSMPLVAEAAVALGLRGNAFIDGIEGGRAALLQLTDRFCFTGEEDFSAARSRRR